MRTKTFVDASLLIAATRGTSPWAERAFGILDDPERVFVSSEFVRLEVLPKAVYNRRSDEATFYREFFDGITDWVAASDAVLQSALDRACEAGLSAVDAIHVAAAQAAGADELVTCEAPQKPLHRTRAVKVVTIY